MGPDGAEVMSFGDDEQYYPTEGCPPEEANARLIAAAPDLLIVAKEAIHHDEGGPHSFDRMERARAAIAKAEGK